MKILIKNKQGQCVIKDEIYGIITLKCTPELENFINECKKFRKNHVFGFYGIFQMTKKTSHFYSVYEDLLSFVLFLKICEYPINLLSFFRYDHFHPFYFSMNFTNIKIFDHDINSSLLMDLYKYHMTIRLSVYYNLMTSQQIHEKIIHNLKLRTHNNQIFICHDSPIFEYLITNLMKKLNDILFLNKYFIAYNFLTKKILEDAILYGIISWKEITELHPDTYYLDKILTWAYYHKKNDICFMMYFLFVPDFTCIQLKDQNIENSEIILWNEPYKMEYKPRSFPVCSFSCQADSNKTLILDKIKQSEQDNFFIYYNYSK